MIALIAVLALLALGLLLCTAPSVAAAISMRSIVASEVQGGVHWQPARVCRAYLDKLGSTYRVAARAADATGAALLYHHRDCHSACAHVSKVATASELSSSARAPPPPQPPASLLPLPVENVSLDIDLGGDLCKLLCEAHAQGILIVASGDVVSRSILGLEIGTLQWAMNSRTFQVIRVWSLSTDVF
jgi:hypothetical protein